MGEIKKYEKITASDINTLKSKVLEIYANRNYLINAGLIKVTSDTSELGTTPASYNPINQNLYFLLNALLQLHDITDVIKNNKYDIIFQNGVTTDLLTTISSWAITDPKT